MAASKAVPPIEALPTHILSYILLKVPINNHLIRAKFVCKSWFTLISSSEFTALYLRHNNALSSTLLNHSSPSTNQLLVFSEFDDHVDRHTLYSVKVNDDSMKVKKVSLPQNLEKLRTIKILASCYDLLLCLFGGSSLVLLNPSTSLYREIPSNYEGYPFGSEYIDSNIYGVGYDDRIDDYKIVVFARVLDTVIYFYRLRDGFWHRRNWVGNIIYHHVLVLPPFPSITRIPPIGPVVVAGYLLNYLQFSNETYYLPKGIYSFNILDGNWGNIWTPKLEGKVKDIGVLNGWLCFLEEKHTGINLWVMKEYGIKESWVLLFSNSDLLPMRSLLLYTPLAISSDKNEILLHLEHKDLKFSFVWYNLKEKKAREAQICDIQRQKYVSLKSSF